MTGSGTQPPATPWALTVAPFTLAILGVVIPLVGSSFTVWGIALVWLAAVLIVAVGRSVARPQPATRMLIDLVLLVMTAVVFAVEGGWWFVPAVVAQGLIDWRAAAATRSEPRRGT